MNARNLAAEFGPDELRRTALGSAFAGAVSIASVAMLFSTMMVF